MLLSSAFSWKSNNNKDMCFCILYVDVILSPNCQGIDQNGDWFGWGMVRALYAEMYFFG